MTCFAAKHLKFESPLKKTVAPKVSCLYVFDQRVPLVFHFSQPSRNSTKQHTYLQKLFITSINSCKEYIVERKQIKSTKAANSKLRMFGGKTCHDARNYNLFLIFPHVYTLRCNRRYKYRTDNTALMLNIDSNR